MDPIDAPDNAAEQTPAEKEHQATHAAETPPTSQSSKTNQAELQSETKDFSAWLAIPKIPNWTVPKPFIAKPPYGVFPPEIWLLILEHCSTSSVKNVARSSKRMHILAMIQLLDTVVVGQGMLGWYTLPEALDNATVISDPAVFATCILNHKHIYWYKAIKTVFVVYRSGLYVIRASDLPLVCHDITARFGPQEDLRRYEWMIWTKKIVIVLWPAGMWMIGHPIVREMEMERREMEMERRGMLREWTKRSG
jgi:hypothetical protein